MSNPELNPLLIREFLESNGDRISEAVRKTARLGAGGHEPVGVEAEILHEQASSAIVEALAGVIDATDDTLHVGLVGDVTIIAEIVPEGPRTRRKVLLRAGRTLPVASLPVPSRGEAFVQPHQLGREPETALEQGITRRAIADSQGELQVRGATPGEEFEVVHTPNGEIGLIPLSTAMAQYPHRAQQRQEAVGDEIWEELAAYNAQWRVQIDEVVGRIATDFNYEESPEEHDLLVDKIDKAYLNAMADALSRRQEVGVSYAIVYDVVLGIHRPLTESSIMVWAARLGYRGEWLPSILASAATTKRRKRGRK